MADKPLLSLNDLNLSTPCETGYEFEYIPESTGQGSGVFLTVVGAHSDRVKSWVRENLNRIRMREAMLEKKGKEGPRPVEDDEAFAVGNAAIRIISWRGIADEYSEKNAALLCSINPEVRDQVLKASEDLKNFIKAK